jgi:23S rRNA pseudoU1915 N3-methylase RlmH
VLGAGCWIAALRSHLEVYISGGTGEEMTEDSNMALRVASLTVASSLVETLLCERVRTMVHGEGLKTS